MGSAKDVYILKTPEEGKTGIGRFEFSDRYSVYDWGEMPDELKNKGKALCMMAAYFFEKAEEEGINTHYRGLVLNNNLYSISDLNQPVNTMEVDLVRVMSPLFKHGTYIYPSYSNMSTVLIPLEIIYRNTLPKGSSVFRRIKDGTLTPEQMGLDHYPVEGEKLNPTFYDVSTKLESKDRYIGWEEAKEIADLKDSEVDQVKHILQKVNDLITREVEKAGLKNEDGKIELAFNENRDIIVVDVFGTPDECRWTYDGIQVNKQMLRDFYENTDWAYDVRKAKQDSKELKTKDWKSLCPSEPPVLDKDLKKITEQVYMSLANTITGKQFFDVPELDKIVEDYRYWRKHNLKS